MSLFMTFYLSTKKHTNKQTNKQTKNTIILGPKLIANIKMRKKKCDHITPIIDRTSLGVSPERDTIQGSPIY